MLDFLEMRLIDGLGSLKNMLAQVPTYSCTVLWAEAGPRWNCMEDFMIEELMCLKSSSS